MSTNHNRIKVSDLETDDPDKILITNSKGELEFIPTKNIKIDSYNALDYDQEGKALDARQGKILKDLVNNKTEKGGFQGTAQDLANSIPDLNSSNLKLGSYPSTRNDGQLSTNKVLSTDVSGNLKLYSLPTSITYPAPYITEILPNNYLPNTTGNIVLKGSFFTPTMTVVIQGQTINYLAFKSDNEVHVNVTTGASEGSFDITLNNGLSVVFAKRMLVIGGTVHKPIDSEWINKTLVTTNNDEVSLVTFGSASSNAEWTKVFDYTKNWEFRIRLKHTPLGSYAGGVDYGTAVFNLKKIVSNTSFAFGQLYMNGLKDSAQFIVTTPSHVRTVSSEQVNPGVKGMAILETLELKLKYQAGVLYAYNGSTVLFTFSDVLNENLNLVVKPKYYDWTSIKYIEF